MAAASAFEISPGESAYSQSNTGAVYFGAVNSSAKTSDAVKFFALGIAALALVVWFKKRR
jgi:hypothetical protein